LPDFRECRELVRRFVVLLQSGARNPIMQIEKAQVAQGASFPKFALIVPSPPSPIKGLPFVFRASALSGNFGLDWRDGVRRIRSRRLSGTGAVFVKYVEDFAIEERTKAAGGGVDSG